MPPRRAGALGTRGSAAGASACAGAVGHSTGERGSGTYEKSGPQRGTPRTFEAAVTYTRGDGKDEKA
ncbi:hypothetical protein AB0M64_18580, partial [Streptomyces sp. NPDC051771]|uniref:hypothetical protein n=1 Tax=Streptomyces sp. NPDC051771 TaxID=3154847 RepID=UPI003417F3A9